MAINFITELTNKQITKTYTGKEIKGSVKLGDLDYPIDNINKSSVFGAWQDIQSGVIYSDDDFVEDGAHLTAINTAPVSIAEINAFVETNQIQYHQKLNNKAPRRLVGQPITKYSKIGWVDGLGSKVTEPNSYPLKGLSFDSSGDTLINNDDLISQHLSTASTVAGNGALVLPIYDVFVQDLKGHEQKAKITFRGNGGRLNTRYDWENNWEAYTPRYGETLRQFVDRKGGSDIVLKTSKFTPPAANQYFAGWKMGDEVVDMSSKFYIMNRDMAGNWQYYNIDAVWKQYPETADSTPENPKYQDTSSANVFDNDGDLLGSFDNLPVGTSANDLLNGTYPYTNAAGEQVPAGQQPLADQLTSDKPISTLAKNDQVISLSWEKETATVVDNSKSPAGLTYADLESFTYADLSGKSWGDVMAGIDPSTKKPATEKYQNASVKLGDYTLSQSEDGTLKIGDTVIYDGNTDTFKEQTASGFKVKGAVITFDAVQSVGDSSNIKGFTTGTATIKTNNATTSVNGQPFGGTDALQPGLNDVTTQPAHDMTPTSDENPANVKIPQYGSDGNPLYDPETGSQKYKEMLIGSADIGQPLDSLEKHDIPNYTIGNGWIVTTSDGEQHLVPSDDTNWADGLGNLDGAILQPNVIYPDDRFNYKGDANGGKFIDGSTQAVVYSNRSELPLTLLQFMMPPATKQLQVSVGYGLEPTSDKVEDVTVDAGSTIWAIYGDVGGSFKRYPREFYLVDRTTITENPDDLDLYDLNDSPLNHLTGSGVFMYEPDGLGYKNHKKVAESVNSWKQEGELDTTQDQITASLFFKDYQSFARLGAWVQGRKLTLYTLNRKGAQNFVNIEISELTKSELTPKAKGYLQESVTFDKVSDWYEIIENDAATGMFSMISTEGLGDGFITFTHTVTGNTVTYELEQKHNDNWETIASESFDGLPSNATIDYSTKPLDTHALVNGKSAVLYMDLVKTEALVAKPGSVYRVVANGQPIKVTITRTKQIN